MNREELVLTASLTRVNQEISKYVLRVLDEDRGNGTTEYTRPLGDVEHALAAHMDEVSHTLRARAAERSHIALESEATVIIDFSETPHRKPALPEF